MEKRTYWIGGAILVLVVILVILGVVFREQLFTRVAVPDLDTLKKQDGYHVGIVNKTYQYGLKFNDFFSDAANTKERDFNDIFDENASSEKKFLHEPFGDTEMYIGPSPFYSGYWFSQKKEGQAVDNFVRIVSDKNIGRWESVTLPGNLPIPAAGSGDLIMKSASSALAFELRRYYVYESSEEISKSDDLGLAEKKIRVIDLDDPITFLEQGHIIKNESTILKDGSIDKYKISGRARFEYFDDGRVTYETKSAQRGLDAEFKEQNIKEMFKFYVGCDPSSMMLIGGNDVIVELKDPSRRQNYVAYLPDTFIGEKSCKPQDLIWKIEYDFSKMVLDNDNKLFVVPVVKPFKDPDGKYIRINAYPHGSERKEKLAEKVDQYPFVLGAEMLVKDPSQASWGVADSSFLLLDNPKIDTSKENDVKIRLFAARTKGEGGHSLFYNFSDLRGASVAERDVVYDDPRTVQVAGKGNVKVKSYGGTWNQPGASTLEWEKRNDGYYFKDLPKDSYYGASKIDENKPIAIGFADNPGGDVIEVDFKLKQGVQLPLVLNFSFRDGDWSAVAKSKGDIAKLAEDDGFFVVLEAKSPAQPQPAPPSQPCVGPNCISMIPPGAAIPIDPNVWNGQNGVFLPNQPGKADVKFKVHSKAELTFGNDPNRAFDVYVNGKKLDSKFVNKNKAVLIGLEEKREYAYEVKEAGKTVFQGKFASLSRKQEVNLMYREILGRTTDAGFCIEVTDVNKANSLKAAKAGQPLGIAQQGGKWCKDYQMTATEAEIDQYDKEIEGGGINYWAGLKDTDLTGVLTGIVFDQRFSEATRRVNDLYTGQGSSQTVDYIYDKILGRSPDDSGKIFWRDVLDGKGKDKLTPRSMVLQVVLSDEMLSTSRDYNGWTPEEKVVQLLTYQNFWRKMESNGLSFYKGYKSRSKIAAEFVKSNEFKDKTGKLADEQFVESLWLALLGRGIEEQGLKDNAARLQKGEITRDALTDEVLGSDEFKKKEVNW